MARHLCAFFAIPDRKLRLTVKKKNGPYASATLPRPLTHCSRDFIPLLAAVRRAHRQKRTLCWSYSAKAAYALFSRSQIALGGRQLAVWELLSDGRSKLRPAGGTGSGRSFR
ncbi:hypothetical protein K438DRAFT_1751105 [Mycena galopus ATCC 62051]|nr:hypothetical protein K438DRAFT_1751105 [Mycena galopus ATCC 62051]